MVSDWSSDVCSSDLKRAFLTHMCHDLGHAATEAELPPHIRLAYDGLELDIEEGE